MANIADFINLLLHRNYTCECISSLLMVALYIAYKAEIFAVLMHSLK